MHNDITAIGAQILIQNRMFPIGLNIKEFVNQGLNTDAWNNESAPTTIIAGTTTQGNLIKYDVVSAQYLTLNILPKSKPSETFQVENLPFNEVSSLLMQFHNLHVAKRSGNDLILPNALPSLIIQTLTNGYSKIIKNAIFVPNYSGNPFPSMTDGHINTINFTFAYSSADETINA